MKLHRQAHVVYKTQYHLVWVTRYRRKILVPGVAEYLKKVLRSVREFHPDWFLEEIGVDRDHVHLHMATIRRVDAPDGRVAWRFDAAAPLRSPPDDRTGCERGLADLGRRHRGCKGAPGGISGAADRLQCRSNWSDGGIASR
ncbi:MAG: transposase [Nitrospira sp.]|nr:MAG: transposase [Nitrospira sp.]